MERIISTYTNPKYMNTYIYKHWYLAEQSNIFIVVHDQYLKVGLEPPLCSLSADDRISS
jgi:hypothetical protein